MRYDRLATFLFFLFILASVAASAQNAGGDYRYQGIKPVDSYYYTEKQTSFWELPDWIKLFYVGAMSAAFIGLLKLTPLVAGKIDDILKNQNRNNILNFIYANPGTTIARVTESQQLERATVRYHLYKLESEGKIVFRKMGKFSRLFRNSRTYSDEEQKVIAHLQNQRSRSILLLVLDEPGITNQELTERLGIEKSAIHWHMEKFIGDGLISYIPDGKFKRYFIMGNAVIMLQKHTEAALT